MGVILSVDLYSVQQDSKTADMGLKSKVGVAKKGTSSLRTTIPEGIVEYLNLKPGNSLDWTMERIGVTEEVANVKRARI
jgi:bifunctional DNA-binding transcriptional regulator/antitoxin component of YhaV-PrlF toxin-antitoxin module